LIEFLKLRNSYGLLKNNEISKPSLSPTLFQKIKFKKQISTKIRIHAEDLEQIIIGTTWEFGFDMYSNRKLIQFALDCGLGERNSLGFGFMNLVNS